MNTRKLDREHRHHERGASLIAYAVGAGIMVTICIASLALPATSSGDSLVKSSLDYFCRASAGVEAHYDEFVFNVQERKCCRAGQSAGSNPFVFLPIGFNPPPVCME